MAELVRLSEASRAVSEALANFDHAALKQIQARLQAAVDGHAAVDREPVEAIRSNQLLLAGVLMATEQNLALLQRLRERKAANPWAL